MIEFIASHQLGFILFFSIMLAAIVATALFISPSSSSSARPRKSQGRGSSSSSDDHDLNYFSSSYDDFGCDD